MHIPTTLDNIFCENSFLSNDLILSVYEWIIEPIDGLLSL